MSWIRIWVHLVFSTKNRQPFLKTPEIRESLFEHIRGNAKEKKIHLKTVGGFDDHIHCLILLDRNMTIAKTAQLIKGESSFWINKNNLTARQFAWQDDYWAVGVSESHSPEVIKYIENQEKHHGVKSFKEEIDEFMKNHGWQLIKG